MKQGESVADKQVIADEAEAERVFQGGDGAITDASLIEDALKDTTDAKPAALPRCDCPALEVPHVHEQGGPVALPDDAL